LGKENISTKLKRTSGESADKCLENELQSLKS